MAGPAPVPPLRPGIGFCLQARSTGTPPGRWFINMTTHKLVQLPVSYSGQKVTKDWILTHGLANLQVPFDMGSFRKVKGERAEGAKHTTWCLDVVFHPLMVQLFVDDAFCNTMESFRPFVINLTLKRIEESLNVKLEASSIKLVKDLRYKDGEDGDQTIPREFRELPDENDSFDDELKMEAPSKEEPEEILIEDLTPDVRKAPVLKKGFLNGGKSKLYGPDGSKEGVVPENAGDPLGYIPKRLRNQCKIVDTRSPEYQEHQKQADAAKENNRQQQEFRDTLMSDLDKWAKKSTPDRWEADLPDGTEVIKKYDNDYSRFDQIQEEAELVEDNRDFYFDEKGNVHKVGEDVKPQCPPPLESSEPMMKKGFLENVKKALYADGSSQGTGAEALKSTDLDKLAQLSEGEIMERIAQMSPEEKSMMNDLQSLLDSSIKGEQPKEVKEAKEFSQDQRRVPDYKLEVVEDGHVLQIHVPELDSMKGVDLDVTSDNATLVFPHSLKPLQVKLPTAVIPKKVKAKFSKKTHHINVSLPSS